MNTDYGTRLISLALFIIGVVTILLALGGCGDEHYTVIEGIDEIQKIELCPEIVVDYPEYLLRIDGELFGVYYSPSKTFLALLLPGDYVTTDGRACRFRVHEDLTVEEL